MGQIFVSILRLTGTHFRNGMNTVWRFLGQMGLAIRQLLLWFVWLPIYYLTIPFWLPLSWIWSLVRPQLPKAWRRLGLMGIACRNLLVWGIWQPLNWLWTPFFLLLTKVLLPVVTTILTSAWRLLVAVSQFVWRHLSRLGGYVWLRTAPRRHLWKRRIRSHWRVVWYRTRLFMRRPKRPLKAEIAPAVPKTTVYQPRAFRLATALTAVLVMVILGGVSLQERQTNAASADMDPPPNLNPQVIVLTPTPLPSTPTPQPVPQITPWPTPDPTQSGGAILFTQHLNGNSDIYLLPVGQSDPVRVTTHPAVDRNPVWSPDGSQFAFASNRSGAWDLFVYDIRLGRLFQVTDDLHFDDAPTWSPDGQWLAYESYVDENMDIYLVKVDGTQGPIRLTQDAAADYSPAWDQTTGRVIAFTSRRLGSPDIWLRSLDDPLGSRMVNVTSSPDVVEDDATFSANGRFLAFTTHQDDLRLINAVPINEQVNPAAPIRNLGQQGSRPSWSPDGESLVYVYQRANQSFLVAGSVEAWGIAPQVYVSPGQLDHPSWTAVQFTPEMVAALEQIDGVAQDAPLFVEALANADPNSSQLFELTINAPYPYLNDQVDQSFAALRGRLLEEAGWDVLGRLDKLFEPLNARALPGHSPQSWNKAGRAFDLTFQDALSLQPQIEVVPEYVGNQLYWRLFVKTAVQDGTLGEPLRQIPWDFRARTGDDPRYYDEGGKLRSSIPAGYYVDFTAIAQDYGWERVPAGENWRTYFPDIRYWHFVNRQGLTWEQAMQQLYLPEELTPLLEE